MNSPPQSAGPCRAAGPRTGAGKGPGAEVRERLAGLPEGHEREIQILTETVVEAWLPMAHRLARRYRNRGEYLEDLEQVAARGLFKAVDRYDPARGIPFEPYAIPTTVGEIKRHFRDHTWDVHVPRRVQELRNKARDSLRGPILDIDTALIAARHQLPRARPEGDSALPSRGRTP